MPDLIIGTLRTAHNDKTIKACTAKTTVTYLKSTSLHIQCDSVPLAMFIVEICTYIFKVGILGTLVYIFLYLSYIHTILYAQVCMNVLIVINHFSIL